MFISFTNITEAAWQGPAEVISGTWGSNDNQFGIEYGDTNDVFPERFYLLLDNAVILEDIINGRTKIYNSAGALTKIIKCVKSPTGEWNEECRIDGVFIETTSEGNVWADQSKYKQPKYSLYSPTGQLIKTSTTMPAELGVVKTESRGSGNYRITITYPDKTYILTSDSYFTKYVRDKNGNVYGLNSGGVWRFSQCGKEIAELTMPQEEKETITAKNAPDQSISLDVEYGEPVVAPNGDVYTWKKTLSKYIIVKWTWQDDPSVPSGPDAPTGLTVTPSTTGLYLAWTASAQDPGCVTGYEVARATTSGGVFSTVGTVAASVLKYNDTTASSGTTYYYKIRAVAGSEYSPYTAEVSGKR
jgi:hypothetical protein